MFLTLVCLMIVDAHNWIHGTSRVGKASQLLPAPARAGPRQPHRQVGAGQDFVIEWATGHPGSYYYFVVLKSTDEDRIGLHTEKMLKDYIAQAPSSAYIYQDEKYQRMHISCTHKHPNNPGGNSDCGQTSWNSGEKFEREITPADSFHIDRSPFHPNPQSDMTHFKYHPSSLSNDRRVTYYNPDYPWIEAVHKMRVSYRFPREWDAARFSLPARQGSGEYMIHMLWRGYRDVIDIDVLPAPANDIYGRSGGNREWMKTEHCQYPKYSQRKTRCTFLQPGDSVQSCMNKCIEQGYNKCRALNVVPVYTPDMVKIQGHAPADANVPWQSQGGSKFCKLGSVPSLSPDTLVCYGLIPQTPDDPTFNPETEDKWYVRETDPEDPIFYSTCYRLEVKREFIDNVACPACEGDVSVTPAKWQIGDHCLSCDSISNGESAPMTEAKFWQLADVCEKCF